MATLAGGGADRIVLASEPPFRLGALDVVPAWRQVRVDGESRTLEPRVMQVLVALAQAEGGIVGRDGLVARCWDGRIVGENAINRVISLLRALAAETQAFEIETITKVGYRLKTSDQAPRIIVAQQRIVRRAALASIGAVLAGGAACLLWPEALSFRRREAERYYLAGIDNERLGDAGVTQALAHYRAAVHVDPNYAPAWGAIARALTSLQSADDSQSEFFAQQVRQASHRALQLDPENADALLAQVMIAPSYRNWIGLERLARQALARRPDLSLVQLRLGTSLADTGRFREAAGIMGQALKRQPLLPGMTVRFACLLWQTGRTAAARQLFDWAYRTWPGNPNVWTYRALYLSLSGQTYAALRMAEHNDARAALAGPLPSTVAAICARALAPGAGQAERAAAVEALVGARRAGDVGSQFSILYLAALGRTDVAFEQSYDYLLGKRDPLTGERQPLPPAADRETFLLFANQAAPMRADARFPKLMAAVGLDAYWRATRSRPDYLIS